MIARARLRDGRAAASPYHRRILLAVGYHYVSAEPASEPRAIFPVPVDALAAQLELLARAWELVARDDLLAAVAGERALPERACTITFDDGLRCHHELALPVLERLGAPAIFFVPGLPIAEERVLYVHKVHALRERLDDEELLARLAAAGVAPDAVSSEDAAAHYRYDTPEAARLKFLLNMGLPVESRERVVGAIFAEVCGDEAAFARELYLSREQVRELERRHRALGAHSYAHEPLAKLAPAELDRDLAAVAALLEDVSGERPSAFSYPHGTPSTVDVATARRLEGAGFQVAFTMERALNLSLEEPLLLGRLDANDAPGGKLPLDEIPPRSRYFSEPVQAA